MPNLTFYLSENHADKFQNLDALTDRCNALCCDILGAERKNVHIIFINVKPGYGQPVYAELFFRLTPLRTPEMMEKFMREVDLATQQASGLTARIRCFGSQAEHLFARN
ncbi:hypothetical protein [Kosakonia cowanii]|uniref:hypothetical protein n=1 Tax=Kosakonia cowanii TaxID=208223 RepID=UPI0028AD6879|nr:hypothetical protein [Kosakonia cowanii]